MKFNLILSCFVAILALVNPIQKVLIVTSLQERFSPTEAPTEPTGKKSDILRTS